MAIFQCSQLFTLCCKTLIYPNSSPHLLRAVSQSCLKHWLQFSFCLIKLNLQLSRCKQCPACFYSQSILTTTMRCHSTFSKVTKLRSWLCPSVNSGNQSLALSMTHSASISFSLLESEPWTSISSSCEFPAQLPGKTTLSPTAFWEGQQCRGSSEDSLGVPVEFRLTALEGLPRRFSLFSASFMLILKKKKNWLHQVLAGLVPWPGIEPGCSALAV